MQEPQIIEFYKERNFSDKINVTIEFVRQNIKNLSKIVLIIFGPVSVVFGTLMGVIMLNIPKLADEEFLQSEEVLPFVGVFMVFYFLLIVMALVMYALFISMVYNYLKLYNERSSTQIELKEIWNKSWQAVPKIIGYIIVAAFITMLGVFAFFIGAIYLAIVLSIGVAIMMYEDKGVFEAIGRCFTLIKEKWFSTLGLLIVIGILQYAVQMLFSIPYYAFNFSNIFLSWQNPEAMMEPLSPGTSVAFVLSFILLSLGGFFSGLLPAIALSYQYSNLVERQESKGLMQKIEAIDDKKDDSYL